MKNFNELLEYIFHGNKEEGIDFSNKDLREKLIVPPEEDIYKELFRDFYSK